MASKRYGQTPGMLLCAAASVLLLAGCDKTANLYTNDPVIEQGQADPALPGRVTPFDLDTGCFPNEKKKQGTSCTPAYEQISEAGTNAEKAALRKKLQLILMRMSDSNCTRHKAGILYINSTYNAAGTAATGILSAVSAIITGSIASQALAGAASGITVTQSAINEKVMFNVLAPAIVREIETMRNHLRSELLAKANESYDAYPVDLMLGEVEAFNQACSFFSGLTALAGRTSTTFSAEHLKARITDLTEQIADNETAMTDLSTRVPAEAAQLHDLQSANTVLRRQVSDLQQRLADAPLTTARKKPVDSASDETGDQAKEKDAGPDG